MNARLWAYAGFILCAFSTFPVCAQTKTDGWFITQYIHEDNRDVGLGAADPSDSVSEQLQLGVKSTLDKQRYWVARGRIFNINSHNVESTDEGDPSNAITKGDDSFAELRELYYGYKMSPGMELRIGRQRIREASALWWNSDNDLALLSFKNNDGANGFFAAGEDLGSYRSGQDEWGRDENRFRILGEYRYPIMPQHWLEPRFVFEHDHSGGHDIGDLISYEDVDRKDLTGIYAGLRSTGTIEDSYGGMMSYRGDIIGLAGRQNDEDVTSSGSSYLVNRSEKDDVRAWAIDSHIAYMPWQEGIVFKAGYAIASGDRAGGDDTAFRQTGLEGGSSRTDLERTSQRNFGEMFRPELSNMRIASAGFVYPLNADFDAGFTYYDYRQMVADNDVLRSGLRADPNGNDKHLGQEMDLTLTADVDDALGVKNRIWRDVQWRTVGGMFIPGAAYNNGNDKEAFRLFSEFRVKF